MRDFTSAYRAADRQSSRPPQSSPQTRESRPLASRRQGRQPPRAFALSTLSMPIFDAKDYVCAIPRLSRDKQHEVAPQSDFALCRVPIPARKIERGSVGIGAVAAVNRRWAVLEWDRMEGHRVLKDGTAHDLTECHYTIHSERAQGDGGSTFRVLFLQKQGAVSTPSIRRPMIRQEAGLTSLRRHGPHNHFASVAVLNGIVPRQLHRSQAMPWSHRVAGQHGPVSLPWPSVLCEMKRNV